jgi:hypothetical protein
MADIIIFGCINKDGSIHSGSGFTVDYLGGGHYLINYDTRFSKTPAVVLTQNYRNWEDFGYVGGNTKDNAVLVASDTLKFKVKTGDSNGDGTDRNFAFISIGGA